MANSKNSAQQGSKVFAISISVVAILMVAVVVFTVMANKKPEGKKGKIEVSPIATAVASSVDGTTGPEKIAPIPESGADTEIGKVVPTINAQNFNGEDVTIAPGKPYVLAFIAHWCPHCQREVPLIVGLHNDNKLPADVEFYGIATSTDEKRPNYPPSKWLSKEEWPWKTVADDKTNTLLDKFGGAGFPYLIYVNADGTIASRTSGEQEEQTIIDNAKAISQTK